MTYVLKQYDKNIMSFSLIRDFDGIRAEISKVFDRAFMPLGLQPDNEALLRWLRRRTIPANRAYVQNFLARFGLNERDTKGIIDICRGLSLNDSYWIVPDDFDGKFADYNLYQNRFSRAVALIAFTGYGGASTRTSLASSPEFTTGGMLAKCWRRIDGRIVLFKSGTEGAANSGCEPYSEFLACQAALAVGIDAVPYSLARWKGRLCSTCGLFTDIDHSFIPVGGLVREGGMRAVAEFYMNLGSDYYDCLADMLVFDAVICNTDRHFGNFGFIVDNRSNRIIRPAPLFDHGNSLFNFAMDDDLRDLESYAATRLPATYPDFVEMAKAVMGAKQRARLRKLANFKFKKHQRYNLPRERVAALEGFIRLRAEKLLRG